MLIEFIFWFCCFLALAALTVLAAEVVKRGRRIEALRERVDTLDEMYGRAEERHIDQRQKKLEFKEKLEAMQAAEKARPVLDIIISLSRRNLYRFVLEDKAADETLAISAGGGHPELLEVQRLAERIAESRIVVSSVRVGDAEGEDGEQ